MKHLLLTTIAAVTLVGCGNPEADRALLNAATGKTSLSNEEYIEAVKKALADGADVNAKNDIGGTPLHHAAFRGKTKIADLLRKYGGKTGEELKAEGK